MLIHALFLGNCRRFWLHKWLLPFLLVFLGCCKFPLLQSLSFIITGWQRWFACRFSLFSFSLFFSILFSSLFIAKHFIWMLLFNTHYKVLLNMFLLHSSSFSFSGYNCALAVFLASPFVQQNYFVYLFFFFWDIPLPPLVQSFQVSLTSGCSDDCTTKLFILTLFLNCHFKFLFNISSFYSSSFRIAPW